MDNSLLVIEPVQAIADAKKRADIVITLRKDNILRQGVDYGIIKGTDKPTLLKPGAEKLCSTFHYDPRFELIDKVVEWNEETPFFYFQYCCHLIHIETGYEIATGIGSCNSRESKYRWRWVPLEDVPPHLDSARLKTRSGTKVEFTFSVEKAETTGKYAKPAEYWQMFHDAIASGAARKTTKEVKDGRKFDAWEVGALEYRIPNDDAFSLVNTIDKMAQKRALIAATLIGANASEFFTQDVEDMPGFGYMASGDVVDGEYVETPSGTVDTSTGELLGNDSADRRVRNVDAIYEATKTHFKDRRHFDNLYASLRAKGEVQDRMTDDAVIAAIHANRASEGKEEKGWFNNTLAMTALNKSLKERGTTLEKALARIGWRLDSAPSAQAILDTWDELEDAERRNEQDREAFESVGK